MCTPTQSIERTPTPLPFTADDSHRKGNLYLNVLWTLPMLIIVIADGHAEKPNMQNLKLENLRCLVRTLQAIETIFLREDIP